MSTWKQFKRGYRTDSKYVMFDLTKVSGFWESTLYDREDNELPATAVEVAGFGETMEIAIAYEEFKDIILGIPRNIGQRAGGSV